MTDARVGAEAGPAVLAAGLTLAVVTGTLVVATWLGRPLGHQAVLHGLVLCGLGGTAWATGRMRSAETRAVLSALAVIAVMFFLYSSLGRVAFAAIPWSGDEMLWLADRLIGAGAAPGPWISDGVAVHPWAVEGLAAFYAAFIPYLYFSIFLGLLGRAPEARRVFVLAFALLYGASFMGYLFVPAHGPVVAEAASYQVPLRGGFFYGLVLRSIAALGGPHGAFPSLHIGASVLVMAFDLRHGDRLRGMVYAPLVALIALATVTLRYHYVVDLIAGGVLALGALAVAQRWDARRIAPQGAP